MSTIKATNAAVLKKLNGAANATALAAVHADDAIKAKLAAARKEVKGLRAQREAEAARAQAAIDELAAAKAAKPDHREAVQDRLASAMDEFMAEFEAPSWKRVLAGSVLGLLMSACSGWVIGMAVGYVVSAVLMLTGSAFLAWVIYVLGVVGAMLAGMVIAGKGFSYIASGRVDAHVDAVKAKMSSWFKAAPIVEFTGAHKVGGAS